MSSLPLPKPTKNWLTSEYYDEVKELKSNANKSSSKEFSTTVASVPSVAVSGSELPQTNMSVPDMQLEIHRTFQDIARRKCIVIVTGIPEPQSTNDHDSKAADVEAFTNFCEEHLSIKPSLARKGCLRLGKPANVAVVGLDGYLCIWRLRPMLLTFLAPLENFDALMTKMLPEMFSLTPTYRQPRPKLHMSSASVVELQMLDNPHRLAHFLPLLRQLARL